MSTHPDEDLPYVREDHGWEDAFTDLSSAVIAPPTWVLENLLPPGLVFLAGPPKSNKSTLTMAFAALIAEWKCHVLPPFLSKVHSPGRTLAFSYEANAGELRWMVEKAFGCVARDDARILVGDDPWKYRLDDAHGTTKMLHWMDALNPSLVILDPLRNFHGLDENDAGEMVRIISPMREWAVKNKCTLLVVHHSKKLPDGQHDYTPDSMRGSSALFGMADGVLIVSPVGKETGVVKLHCTFKRAQQELYTLQLGCPGYGWPRAGSEVLSKLEANIGALHLTGASVESIAAQVRLSEREVRAALTKLQRNGR